MNLAVDLSRCEDPEIRASKLYAAFIDKQRYVLILDDMWKGFPLEEVGIPEPIQENGCKLVLTTRLLRVCHYMGCKPIKMAQLEEEEARKLFLSHVGTNVLCDENRDLIVKVVDECGCLPLAITIVARSMAGVTEAHEWISALQKLRECSKEALDKKSKVIEKLKFSYERFEINELKDCFLYCALCPEDYTIYEDELIDHLIEEGIIKGVQTRKEPINEADVWGMHKDQHVHVNVENGSISQSSGGRDFLVFTKNSQDLTLRMCNATSLCNTAFLDEATRLNKCSIHTCPYITHLFSIPFSAVAVQSLKILSLSHLIRLRTLIDEESMASSPLPLATFLHLTYLNVAGCSKLYKLFSLEVFSNLRNMEFMAVSGCNGLRHIVAESSDENAEEDQIKKKGTSTLKFSFPKVKNLHLYDLPKLKTICPNSGVLVCNALVKLSVKHCLKLKRIPLDMPLDSQGRPLHHHVLK